MRTCVVIALFVVCTVSAAAQQVSSETRIQTIAAAFNKHRDVVKEKFGGRKAKYKDVRSEPAVKQNLRDYTGTYEVSELGYVIHLQVGSDGRVQGNGYEKGQQSRRFRLDNAKIEGALLTASKVYEDGTTEKFDGVFLNRTDRNSPTDAGITIFGLGVVLGAPFEVDGLTYEKLFYQLK